MGVEGDVYDFTLPVDFGRGGVVILDGRTKIAEKDDIWEDGQSDLLNLKATLSKGTHVLELYGAEECCDGETKWSFNVNDGD